MTNISKLDDIEIYTEALRLAGKIYSLSKNPKLKYEYSLLDQIKRASLSVAANIAEGYGRNTKKDFAHFLSIANGSINETIAFLDFLKMNFGIDLDELKNEYHTLGKRTISFRKYLQTNN
ncbi:MAG: S23 ribosomal protein [Microgenomates group bacterium Gr01-1014_16]|nr:MAG: S23 ribosomal protein [Microgenomates group bacterium Gr01-1014_16]